MNKKNSTIIWIRIWKEERKKSPQHCCYLESHEFMVGLRGPGINLHRVLQSNHQEFDSLIFHCGGREEREREKKSNQKPFQLSRVVLHSHHWSLCWPCHKLSLYMGELKQHRQGTAQHSTAQQSSLVLRHWLTNQTETRATFSSVVQKPAND